MADGWKDATRRTTYLPHLECNCTTYLPHLECNYGASDMEFTRQKLRKHHHQKASLDQQQKLNTRRVMFHRQWENT